MSYEQPSLDFTAIVFTQILQEANTFRSFFQLLFPNNIRSQGKWNDVFFAWSALLLFFETTKTLFSLPLPLT